MPTQLPVTELTKMQIKETPQGSIAFCHPTPDTICSDWFTMEYWQQKSAITGSSKGRYTTWFVKPDLIETGDSQWVLRHYYRGGLMAKISKDSYLYTGLHKTRAVSELALLALLYSEDFPVPKPVAANVERRGLHYRADIIIERVEGAQDLVAKLSKAPMSDAQWQQLGSCIAKFHERGVYHADLNAKNILITDDNFYLIDFDRGEIRQPDTKWQNANLERLLRSFNKEKGILSSLEFTQDNWQQLMLGYSKA
ncbi:3-deoxy-D-manno-octulosonic acid kinase [Shewanella hanedai]|uniref:3-deoxy-D-manno-octulosonic acid kinase n=1 Tax=Shewanella hanedai TaxID=25 RepID=A0A553JQD1_SHEHA|nr:3-deoxy-D-manno-octulosonic acid kinase [Shewanella hanedai]TRY14638.1 3-deoxy-D-manno-octulosonic acid kinase [Shewanella hanedai]GGI77416.1 3-deoxy-D-manno-octulosonic acid kinase [Shewanella hanedai]